jgi:2-iminobutanoate/2-iminopropanoate deaminase
MTLERRTINAPAAPPAVGPYSHGVSVEGLLLFCSGQIGLDSDGELVSEDLAQQCERCLRNLQGVCAAAGTRLSRAIKLTVYTTEIDRFAEINEVYARYFEDEPPARAAVGVSALPKNAKLMIDAIVAL